MPIVFFAQQTIDTTGTSTQVDSMIQVVNGLIKKSEFEEAFTEILKTERFAFNKAGYLSRPYGKVCFMYGKLYFFKGDNYPACAEWMEKAYSISEELLGKQHYTHLQISNILGITYQTMGKYDKAAEYYLESKITCESFFGKNTPEYSHAINNLATLFEEMGRYEDAERLLIESKEIYSKRLGENSPEYAMSFLNLGNLYQSMGQFEKAESSFFSSMEKWEIAVGKEHPDYALSLYGLGVLYSALGQGQKAESWFLKAKDIWLKTKGEEDADYATCLMSLAGLQIEAGDFEKALSYCMEARDIHERTVGKENVKYATTIHLLASIYIGTGQYDKAGEAYLETKNLREKTLGKTSPLYAKAVMDLGNLYLDMNRLSEAEVLLTEAMTIFKEAYNYQHPNLAHCLNRLAVLMQLTGKNDLAKAYCQEANSIHRNNLADATRYLSERELSAYSNAFLDDLDLYFSFAKNQKPNDPEILGGYYDNALFFKGFLLNTVNWTNRMAATDTTATQQYNFLKSYYRRLASEYAKPIAELEYIHQLETKADSIEKVLARTIAGFGDAIEQVSWQEVQAALKPTEAAIEFFHFNYHDPKPTGKIMYVALLLRPGFTTPLYITLFEEGEISALIARASGSADRRINALYSNSNKEDEKSLYRLIWHPILKYLEGVHTVYYSPSGMLHQINLGAIPVGDGPKKPIAEVYDLLQTNSTRTLVHPNNFLPRGNNAWLMGGVRYAIGTTLSNSASANTVSASRGVIQGATFYQDTTVNRGSFLKYLPESVIEVLEIQKTLESVTWSVQVDTGFYATEESFKKLGHGMASPRIIHIATHGFVFADPIMEAKRKTSTDGSEIVFKLSENPMMRSGLLMAGAQTVWETGISPNHREDGVLTAFEISQMDLSDTELVVLSACETGLGDIVGNEGVYGLQRAFKIAGAKYLIMSLWKVNDEATREFMTEFYNQWLLRKQAIPHAFENTYQTMKRKYPDSPYLWAGFVLLE